jgi:uncharacterized protein (TIRG00374 family)
MTDPASANDKKDGSFARRSLATLLKLLIAALLVFSLFYYRVITLDSLQATFRDRPIAASVIVVLFIGYMLSAVRWYFILHAMGIPIRLRPCAEIFAMGMFASTILPGGTGGDMVRAIYVARHLHQDRTGGVISVLADRALGLFGVIVVAMFFALSGPEHMIRSPLTRAIFSVLAAVFIAGVLGAAAAVTLIGPKRFERIRQFLGFRTIIQRTIVRVIETVLQLRSHPAALLISVLISVVITLTIASAIVLLAHGYGAGGLQPIDFANAGVLALLSSALPVTPGGIGVGEGTFAFLCYAWETVRTSLPYGTIFFGYRLSLTVIAAFGSVAFVTYRRTIP